MRCPGLAGCWRGQRPQQQASRRRPAEGERAAARPPARQSPLPAVVVVRLGSVARNRGRWPGPHPPRTRPTASYIVRQRTAPALQVHDLSAPGDVAEVGGDPRRQCGRCGQQQRGPDRGTFERIAARPPIAVVQPARPALRRACRNLAEVQVSSRAAGPTSRPSWVALAPRCLSRVQRRVSPVSFVAARSWTST